MRVPCPNSVKVLSEVLGQTYNPVTRLVENVVGFTLKNSNHLSVSVMTLGARITSIKYPDCNGNIDDVVLGFDDIENYLEPNTRKLRVGGIIGRTCGRHKNGMFNLGNGNIMLSRNLDHKHHIHGGNFSFDVVNWSVNSLLRDGVKFWLESPDKHEGYPGNLMASISYTLNEDNVLSVTMNAKTDKLTACDMCNHVYFNLAGHDAGKDALKRHLLEIQSCRMLKLNDENLPTGMYQRVNNTPFDFRIPTAIGDHLHEVERLPTNGYEHYFYDCKKSIGAQVLEPKSKRFMVVMANQPGLTFETANNFPDTNRGKFGIPGKFSSFYGKHSAFSLWSHNFPDSINQKEFPSCELLPGQTYCHRIGYRFGVYEKD